MKKKICIIGTGYVGLITAVGLSSFGNNVIGVDIDEEKVRKLNKGESTLYEPGLEEYLEDNLNNKRISFTTDIEMAILQSEIIFIAVGTPSNENGEAELKYLYNVLDSIIKYSNTYKLVVTKSTVPVGTNRKIKEYFISNKKDFLDIVSNPEFLREGKAIFDFFHPDRIIIGYENENARKIMEEIYSPFLRTTVPFLWCNWETAELIKYASNGFLALKIAYINQISNLCEISGADVYLVAKGMGMDGRIGSKFLHPGPGYGGSCFPKDTRALSKIAESFGTKISLIDAVIDANEKQKEHVFNRFKNKLGDLKNKKIGILGLAFKAETDDIRESPAIYIIDKLKKEKCIISAHDPKARKNFSKIFPDIQYVEDLYDVANDAEAILILTEWNEYKTMDLYEIKKRMKNPYIFDTRKVLREEELKEKGFDYNFVGLK